LNGVCDGINNGSGPGITFLAIPTSVFIDRNLKAYLKPQKKWMNFRYAGNIFIVILFVINYTISTGRETEAEGKQKHSKTLLLNWVHLNSSEFLKNQFRTKYKGL
jgi:hypothetical protein